MSDKEIGGLYSQAGDRAGGQERVVMPAEMAAHSLILSGCPVSFVCGGDWGPQRFETPE